MKDHRKFVLWSGAAVALVQSAYHLVLALITKQKIAILEDLSSTSAISGLTYTLDSHLNQAFISLFFLSCFVYLLFHVIRQKP